MRDRYFLTEKTVRYILLVGDLKTSNVTRIVRNTKMSFWYALKITKYLQNLDIITAEKKGRTRKIELTKKGSEIYMCLKNITNIVKLNGGILEH